VESADNGKTAKGLLEQAADHHRLGEQEKAAKLYGQVASGSHPVSAVAAAAAGLARLGAHEDAQDALRRVIDCTSRPALATARLGEAAAGLGDLDLARECAREVVEQPDAERAALRSTIRVLEQAGDLNAALQLAREIADVTSVERIEGVLKSYDPAWLPTGRQAHTSLRPANGEVLVLLENSLPHIRSGYTYRAQTLLRAQQRAGLKPTVSTRLGYPATRGVRLLSPVDDVHNDLFDAVRTPVELVDGVEHCRTLLPGLKYYSSVPLPEQLTTNVDAASLLVSEKQAEAIIATTPHLNGLLGLALRQKWKIPLIYDVRGFPEMTWAVRKGGERSETFRLRRAAETRCMREADLVTTLSETMRQQIIRRGVKAENVFLLPHAMDTDAFSPTDRDENLAGRLGLAGRPVVGYISSLVAYEGVETLLDAIAAARRRNPDLAGLIVGGGERQSSLEAHASRIGLDGHVIFTGRIDAEEVSAFYSVIDVFVCPRQDHEVTRYVTPLKPFEAMATGACLVVSDLPTLREAVRDGDCGALFPAGDSEALAATILGLIESHERSHALREAARRHVVENHSLNQLTRSLEKAWSELQSRAMRNDQLVQPPAELDCL